MHFLVAICLFFPNVSTVLFPFLADVGGMVSNMVFYQGAPPCTHFMQRGMCKFGPACKFDHSMERLSYSPSASSLADMPVAPYPVGSVVGTLAPSSSSSELRPEQFSGSRKDSNPSRMSSSMSTSSGLVGSTTSRTEMPSHSSVQRSSQSSGPSVSSTSSTTSVEGRTWS